MSKIESNFVAKCLAGEALADDIDDYVDRWHEGEGNPDESLAQYLGFTDEEYKLWAEKPNFLPFLLNARRRGSALKTVEDYGRLYPLAASDLNAEDAEQLTDWLMKTGRIAT